MASLRGPVEGNYVPTGNGSSLSLGEPPGASRAGTWLAPGKGMIAILFWAAVLAVLHTYVFYPLLLIVLDGFEQARGAWVGSWPS